MTRRHARLILITAFLTLWGCRSFDGFAGRSALLMVEGKPRPRALLASHRVQTTPKQSPTDKQTPPRKPRDQSQADSQPENAPPDEPETEQNKKTPAPLGYTAPGEAIRQAALLAMAIPKSDADTTLADDGGGKELAESLLGTSTTRATPSVFGSPGLTAPQPTVAGAVVSRPGLQEGPASGIGFASPFNILTPQVNPLSGPMGRCNDLVRAGFFGGNNDTCVGHFRPR
ncbi:MAG: hypothetical protein IIB61_06380 [Planctomycetes bacterium]|nr:hypothetical protein [Planctomycetota bacterium]